MLVIKPWVGHQHADRAFIPPLEGTEVSPLSFLSEEPIGLPIAAAVVNVDLGGVRETIFCRRILFLLFQGREHQSQLLLVDITFLTVVLLEATKMTSCPGFLITKKNQASYGRYYVTQRLLIAKLLM